MSYVRSYAVVVSIVLGVGCQSPLSPPAYDKGEIMPEHQPAIEAVHAFFGLTGRVLPVYWVKPDCPEGTGFIYGHYGCIGGIMLSPDGIWLMLDPNQKRHSDWSGLVHEVAHYWLEVVTGDYDMHHERKEVWGDHLGYPTYGIVYNGMQFLRLWPEIDVIQHRVVDSP